MEDTTDLGRQHVLIAGLFAQRRAHAQFAAAIAVERRGIEVAHAVFIGGIDQCRRFGVGDRRTKAAHRGAAEAKFGNFELRRADLASVERHSVLSRRSACHRVCRSTQSPTIANIFRGANTRREPAALRSVSGHRSGHKARPAAKVRIRAREHERRTPRTGLPLVFPPKDAKLFVSTLDEVLTALYSACTVVRTDAASSGNPR